MTPILQFSIQILLLILATGCYIITQLWTFGRLGWAQKSPPLSFWGSNSNARKYPIIKSFKNGKVIDIPDTTRERFIGSTTVFVFLTDGYHLLQFIAFRLIYLAIAISTPHIWWVWGVMCIVHPVWFWAFQRIFKSH